MFYVIVLTAIFAKIAANQNVTYQARSSENSDREFLKRQILAYFDCADEIKSQETSKRSSYCNPFFDGWGCWPKTPSEATAVIACPGFVYDIPSSIKGGKARLKCEENGVWQFIPAKDRNSVVYKECNFHKNEIDMKILNETVQGIMKTERSFNHPDNRVAYLNCVRNVLLQPGLVTDEPYCPRTFDDWGCWNDTPAGTVAYTKCPSFITGLDPKQIAHKVCTDNGTWFLHPQTKKPWSNYTTCVDQEDLLFRQKVNHLYISGYTISIFTLVVSTFIFFYFRSLNCTRVTIHKNFFISFIINNTLWIVWYTVVVSDTDVITENGIGCRFLHAILHYFLLSNYMWMFCEGFYLHTILVITFICEEKMMIFLYVIGWGVPAIFISIYVGLREDDLVDNTYCWIDDSKYKWLLIGPVCVSLLLNVAFLINIVRLLVTKLRSVNNPEANHSRKAVRATIILIPLLGLNYILTPFRPETKTTGEIIYEITSAVATSFQGLFVSLLLCFFNSEVMQVIHRKWTQKQLMYSGCHRMSFPNTTISTFESRKFNDANNHSLPVSPSGEDIELTK
ncbi:CALCRL (predicted) [Pycnogonum litorale]